MVSKKADLSNQADKKSSNKTGSEVVFTPAEAKEFFDGLYEDIFINNRIELLSKYYENGFIGHCNDQMFDLEDVKQRAFILNNYANNIKFKIRKIVVSGLLVIVSKSIHFTLKENGSLYEVSQYTTFQIQNGKIKESWVINDQEVGSYHEYNQTSSWQSNSDLLLPFEINQKYKEEYITRIKTALQVNMPNLEIPKRELECLYYYLAGYTAKETAIAMKLSPRTIESYLLHIKFRFNTKNRLELRNNLFRKI